MLQQRQDIMKRKYQRIGIQVVTLVVVCLGGGGFVMGQSGSVIINAAEEGLRSSYSATESDQSTEERNRINEPLHSLSLITTALPEPTQWYKNDLLQVLIRESSKISNSQELSTEKKTEITGGVTSLPLDGLEHFVLNQAQIGAVDLASDRSFEGTGEYDRDDEFTARLTARVVEVLPNGHLVIEARTYIETDDEESMMKLSGICDPNSVSPAGTILSSDIFDLRLVKEHEGELRKANKKGFFSKVIEAIFAF